jgi:predicted aspartyl protease
MSGLRPPASLDLSNIDYSLLETWFEAFEDYYSLYSSKPDDEEQCKLLLTVAGLGTRTLLRGFDPKPKTYKDLKNAILNHVQPIKSVCIERHKFLSSRQMTNESVNDFVARLKSQASLCDFDSTTIDTVTNQLVRDQLIIGVNNKKISEALLEAGEVSLIDTVKKANAIEQAGKDLSSLNSQSDSLLAMDQRPHRDRTDRRAQHDPKANKPRPFCSYCKRTGHTFEKCFKRAICGSCGRTGHTTDYCRSKKLAACEDKTRSNLRYIKGQFLGKEITFLLDTGASLSVLNKSLIDKFDWHHLIEETSTTVTLADGRKLELTQSLEAAVLIADTLVVSRFFVAESSPEAILGMDVLSKLPISINIGSEQVLSVLPDLVSDFEDIFDKDLKDCKLQGVHCSEVIPILDEKPIRSHVRRFTAEDQIFLSQKVSDLHASGVIEVSHSPWRSTPVIVKKPDGSKRLAINYKPVNSQTTFDAFPVPDVDSLISQLSGAKCFSKMDFSQFYHQIPLVESDRAKTAFYADGQLWQYTRLPFGLRNAVAVCSRVMRSIFDGIPNVLIYLDDVLIFAPDKETHDQTLIKVLTLIRQHGLGLNKRKCMFNLSSVEFLGFQVENGAVKPSPDRLQSVIDFPLPGDKKALQRFIGMATYFSKYVQHFSDLIKPILDLKNSLNENSCANPVIDYWPPASEVSFAEIKTELANSVLVLPAPEQELVLRTDASDTCIGAVLQTSSGQPVSFLSRVLTDTEQRYDIVEKEALAVYWGIIRSRMFLLGRKFKVISDHRPIQFLYNSDKASHKVLRWRLALQEFDFEVVFCPGKENVVADCFSRINFVDFAPPCVDVTYVERVQSFDDECKLLINAVECQRLQCKPDGVSETMWSQRKTLRVKERILYNDKGQIYVPFKARIKVLTVCHALHRGITATVESIRATCFWPRMRKDVEEFIKKCRICCFTKPTFMPPPNEPLLTKAPMEILALDYIGPLPEANGFKYILTGIDLFSRYAFAIPVRNLSAETLIDKCKDIFAIAGFPDCILTDRGSQFLSSDFLSFLKRFNIRKLSTNAYSPWSNGCSERFNGTLQRSIYSYLKEIGLSRFCWPRAVPTALLNYRTTVHSATKCRPVDLFFGFNVKGLGVFGNKRRVPHQHSAHNQPSSHACPSRPNKAEPIALQPGQKVLVKFPFSPKFSEKGRPGFVEKQFDQHTVRVSFTDGSYVDAGVHRVSLLPSSRESFGGPEGVAPAGGDRSHGSGDDVGGRWGNLPPLPPPTPQTPSPVSTTSSSSSPSDGADLPRRSGRLRRPPVRYGIDDRFVSNFSRRGGLWRRPATEGRLLNGGLRPNTRASPEAKPMTA